MPKRLQLFVFIALVHLCGAYALTAYKFSGVRQNDAFEAASTLCVLPVVLFVRPISETRLLVWLPLNSMFWASVIFAAVLLVRRVVRRPQKAS